MKGNANGECIRQNRIKHTNRLLWQPHRCHNEWMKNNSTSDATIETSNTMRIQSHFSFFPQHLLRLFVRSLRILTHLMSNKWILKCNHKTCFDFYLFTWLKMHRVTCLMSYKSSDEVWIGITWWQKIFWRAKEREKLCLYCSVYALESILGWAQPKCIHFMVYVHYFTENELKNCASLHCNRWFSFLLFYFSQLLLSHLFTSNRCSIRLPYALSNLQFFLCFCWCWAVFISFDSFRWLH